MSFNLDAFRKTIDDSYEIDMDNLTESLIDHTEKFYPVSPNVQNAICLAAKESYLAALKTLEQAVISAMNVSDSSDRSQEEN